MSSTTYGSSDDVERNLHEDTTGYKLRKRSRETRNKMARMARAMYEDGDDDDDLSESSFSPAEKRPRSHVRASATKRERARRHKLNMAYDKLRRVVPKLNCERLSKIATLRSAIDYIAMLTNYLDGKMENEAFSQSSTENSADEDTASSIEDNDSNILAKLIDSVVDEFGWFLGKPSFLAFVSAIFVIKTGFKSLN
jgi:hypothetical protein